MFLTAKVHVFSGIIIGALAVMAMKQMCKTRETHKRPVQLNHRKNSPAAATTTQRVETSMRPQVAAGTFQGPQIYWPTERTFNNNNQTQPPFFETAVRRTHGGFVAMGPNQGRMSVTRLTLRSLKPPDFELRATDHVDRLKPLATQDTGRDRLSVSGVYLKKWRARKRLNLCTCLQSADFESCDLFCNMQWLSFVSPQLLAGRNVRWRVACGVPSRFARQRPSVDHRGVSGDSRSLSRPNNRRVET